MKNIIGTFAKAEWRGKEVFGMVISTHNVCGKEKVGFAFADQTQWVAFLCENPTLVTENSEVAKAYASAKLYWEYELNSLEQRAAMKYDIDDEKELSKLIATAKEWVGKLK